MVADERLTLARTSLEIAVAQQTASRTNVRNLAMTVLGAAAVAAAFSANAIGDTKDDLSVITYVCAALGLIAFVAMCIATGLIIWSHDAWTFGTSGAKVKEWADAGYTIDAINDLVIAALIQSRRDNEKAIVAQSRRFKACVVLLVVVVLASVLVVGTARI